jgi:hypothetical protein
MDPRVDIKIRPVPPRPGRTPEDAARAASLLYATGWDAGQLVQIAIYAEMPPAQKVAQMLRLRRQFMERLRARLAAEHPDLPPQELAALVLDHLTVYYQH